MRFLVGTRGHSCQTGLPGEVRSCSNRCRERTGRPAAGEHGRHRYSEWWPRIFRRGWNYQHNFLFDIEGSSCPSWNYPHGRPSEQTPQGRLKLIVAPCYRSTAMRACIAIVFLLLIVPGWALDLVINDGDTRTLDGTEFRLDGIDAPEKDQVCVDDKGALWACGIEARDHLAALIGERAVRCEDMGADTFYPKRRIGRCSVEGENTTLNQRLGREGWALSFRPY